MEVERIVTGHRASHRKVKRCHQTETKPLQVWIETGRVESEVKKKYRRTKVPIRKSPDFHI